MHSVCLGAIVLASLTATTLSAQNQHVQVWFKVTDTVNENIEGARISLRPSPGATNLEVTTGGNGMVETELEPGSYDVQVKSRIFKDWKRRIEVSNDPIQVISIIMDVDCDHSLCQMVVTADPPQLRTAESTRLSFPDVLPVEVDRVSPDVQIPLVPVKGLQIVGTKVRRKRRLVSQ
jgi:hypothetical protein